MAHSYRVHFFHIIWSTKNRQTWITDEVKPRLYSYMGGIVRNEGGTLIAIGGMPDHVHMLVEYNSIDKFSNFVRALKASSSFWIHKNFPDLSAFAWQEGYGSFSVSYSSLDSVREYIKNQEIHHKTFTFEEEFVKYLNVHCLKYDERYVLG